MIMIVFLGIALFQLAKMYEHVGEVDQAASAYHQVTMKGRPLMLSPITH